MTIRYTLAVDGVIALNNFKDNNNLVADTITGILDKVGALGAIHGARSVTAQKYRIYKGTLKSGGYAIQHYVWIDAEIPKDAKSITFDAVPVGGMYPPHKTRWDEGFKSVDECLSSPNADPADSEWKIFPVVGLLEHKPDVWEISEVL